MAVREDQTNGADELTTAELESKLTRERGSGVAAQVKNTSTHLKPRTPLNQTGPN